MFLCPANAANTNMAYVIRIGVIPIWYCDPYFTVINKVFFDIF